MSLLNSHNDGEFGGNENRGFSRGSGLMKERLFESQIWTFYVIELRVSLHKFYLREKNVKFDDVKNSFMNLFGVRILYVI